MRRSSVLCVSFFIIRTAQTKWLRFLLLSFMTMGFLWIHQVFLPVLVSGAYLAAVIRCGSALTGVSWTGTDAFRNTMGSRAWQILPWAAAF